MSKSNDFSQYWEKEIKRANNLFDKKFLTEANSTYINVYKQIDKVITASLKDKEIITHKTLLQLVITNDSIADVFSQSEQNIEQIKYQVKTLKTLIKVIQKDPEKANLFMDLFNQVYLKYCKVIDSTDLRFSQTISEQIVGDKISIDQFHYSLKFNQSKKIKI